MIIQQFNNRLFLLNNVNFVAKNYTYIYNEKINDCSIVKSLTIVQNSDAPL